MMSVASHVVSCVAKVTRLALSGTRAAQEEESLFASVAPSPRPFVQQEAERLHNPEKSKLFLMHIHDRVTSGPCQKKWDITYDVQKHVNQCSFGIFL